MTQEELKQLALRNEYNSEVAQRLFQFILQRMDLGEEEIQEIVSIRQEARKKVEERHPDLDFDVE